MSIRPFVCRTCGHRMRFQGKKCSRCYDPRELHQRGGFYVLGLLAALAIFAGIVFLIL